MIQEPMSSRCLTKFGGVELASINSDASLGITSSSLDTSITLPGQNRFLRPTPPENQREALLTYFMVHNVSYVLNNPKTRKRLKYTFVNIMKYLRT